MKTTQQVFTLAAAISLGLLSWATVGTPPTRAAPEPATISAEAAIPDGWFHFTGTRFLAYIHDDHVYWTNGEALAAALVAAPQGPIVGPTGDRNRSEYRSTWRNASGATHTIITPRRRDTSLRDHIRDVKELQLAFPPVVPPPAGS